MSGVLDTFDYLPDAANPVGRRTADLREAPDFFDTTRASYRLSIDDIGGAPIRGRHDAYWSVMDALPADAQARVRAAVLRRQNTSPDSWYDGIWTEATRLRVTQPGALKTLPMTKDAFEKKILDDAKAARAKDRDTTARGGFVANLAGGVGASFFDPINLATMGVGGGSTSILRTMASEAAINAGVEVIEQPFVAAQRAKYGEELTLGEAAANVGTAAVFGGLLGGGLKTIELKGPDAARWAGGKLDVLRPLDQRLASALEADIARGDLTPATARLRVESVLRETDPRDLPGVIRALVPDAALTPTASDALRVLERDNEIRATSPFDATHAGDAEHGARVVAEMTRMMADQPPAPARLTPPAGPLQQAVGEETERLVGDGAAAAFKARVRRVESRGNDGARNTRSSATGRFQFIDSTWLRTYRKAFPNSGESDAAILARRGDGALQEQLMDVLTRDNARALARGGVAETPGNLYLAHFAGPEGALKLHRADPATPARAVLGDAAIKANPFLERMTAADVIDWAHRKMGTPVIDGARATYRPDEFGADLDALRLAQNESDAATMARLQDEVAEAARLRQEQGLDDIGDPQRVADDREELVPWETDAAPAAETADLTARRAAVHKAVAAYIDQPRLPLNAEHIAAKTGFNVDEVNEALGAMTGNWTDTGNRLVYRTIYERKRVNGKMTKVLKEKRLQRRPIFNGPKDLYTFVASIGGLRDDEGHAIRKAMGIDPMTPIGPMLRKNGVSLDRARELAAEAGYFHNRYGTTADDMSKSTVADFLELLDQNGRAPIYLADDMGRVADAENARASSALDEEVAYHLDRAAEWMGVELTDDMRRMAADYALANDLDWENGVAEAVRLDAASTLDEAFAQNGDIDYDPARYDENGQRLGDEPYNWNDLAAAEGSAGSGSPRADAREGGARTQEPQGTLDPASLTALDAVDTPEGVRAQVDSTLHDLQMEALSGDAQAAALSYRLDEEGDEVSLDGVLGEVATERADVETMRACMAPPGGAA